MLSTDKSPIWILVTLLLFLNTLKVSAQSERGKTVQNKTEDTRTIALKTNLLFDAATILNGEIEVSLFDEFSIAAEIIHPWWVLKDKQHALQVRALNVEGRYWFSKSGDLTGLFAGWHTWG